MRAPGALLAAALLLAPCAAPAATPWWQRWLGGAAEARIERTAHGLVHLTAPDEASLGYAWGYAQGQDRGCEVAEALVTAAGERGRWFGAEAGVRLGGRIVDNRTSDFFVRDHLDDAALERAWNAASPDARALMDGLVRGWNRWREELSDAGRARAIACAQAPWLRAMTVADLRRLVELEMVADGEGAWADAITRAQPPGSPPLHEPPPRPPLGEGPGAREAASRPGGVALAIGRDVADGGGALLLANPHATWTGWDRPWPVHLVIPGRLDALGASPGLLPMLRTGANRSLAWSTTRSAARHLVLHQLALAPGDPTTYLVDGRREAMTWKRVRTVERVADGIEPVDRALYRTRWGPVVVVPELGMNWTRDTAWALEDVDVADARGVETWLAVARADSVPALRQALAGRGTGDLVVVAADGQGRVAYADPGAVPDLGADRLQRCLAPGGAGPWWGRRGLAVLDGTRAECDRPPEPGVARPGVVPLARTPWLERTDWVQSSGDSAWLAQPAAPGGAFEPSQRDAWSPLQGGDPAPLPLRTRALVAAIARALAPPRAALDVSGLVALWTDPSDEAWRLVHEDVAAMCRKAATEASRAGCAALAGWDGRDAADSAGALVFREWWRRVQDLPDRWRLPFSPADPLGTPRGLRLSDVPDRGTGRARTQELLEALAQAVFALRQAGFAADARLGAAQFVELSGTKVALPGGEAVQGTVATIEGRNAVALSRLGYEPAYGSSWLMAVRFGPRGREAWGVMLSPVTDRDDPASRRASLEAAARGDWFPLPFTAGEIAAQRVGEPQVLRTW